MPIVELERRYSRYSALALCLGDGARLGVALHYAVEKEPPGTGGGVRLSRERLLAGCESGGFFLDIGLPETFGQAQTLLPQWRRDAGMLP